MLSPFLSSRRIGNTQTPPQPYGKEHADMLFKPDGAVFSRPCHDAGLRRRVLYRNVHDWAKRAIDRGYAVMVADPLWQRKVEDNCDDQIPIPMSRMLKDALEPPRRCENNPSLIQDASAT